MDWFRQQREAYRSLNDQEISDAGSEVSLCLAPCQKISSDDEFVVYDVSGNLAEEIYESTGAGTGISGCGATKIVIGSDNWEPLGKAPRKIGRDDIKEFPCHKTFGFCHQCTRTSKKFVDFQSKLHGVERRVVAYIVPGATPFLVARPCVSKWKMIVDFEDGTVQYKGMPELGLLPPPPPPPQCAIGHFRFDLLSELQAAAEINANSCSPSASPIDSGSEATLTSESKDADELFQTHGVGKPILHRKTSLIQLCSRNLEYSFSRSRKQQPKFGKSLWTKGEPRKS